MALYEALYRRKCRSPVCWDEVGERPLLGSDLVEETSEKVKFIKEKLLAAQSRQKSYVDSVKRRPLVFDVGDHVFLKVSPWKGVQRFGKKGKLAPRYIGPFEILERVGEVAYQLALPPALSNVHDVFHISMLRRYIPDPSHVLDYDTVPVQDDLSYEELPVRILDRKARTLRNRTISMVKVQWQFHKPDEATWEREKDIRERYPHLF
ncbi:Chromo domain-containing protein [Cephalotus follicularis]|uniref:Chromo domain-containing protein n=1 Tax=Cephalotus follicularis TaxID=3775 RepID=A0A1Q3AQ56_CEPFO|nr:Chromo domain-containing protein [Cephalotus follicularis]